MLVLARRAGESVVIDGRITVTVVEVARSGQVRLGITAPREVRIVRQELVAEVADENRHALAQADLASAALAALSAAAR